MEKVMKAILSQHQKEAAQAKERVVYVTAAAGSGKTRVLVERFMDAVLKKGKDPSKIVVITYTRKTAKELQERILERLTAAGFEEPAMVLQNGCITTIDGFCSKVLKENAIDAGVDPFFTVLDEDAADLFREEAAERFLDETFRLRSFDDLFGVFSADQLKNALLSVYEKWRCHLNEPSAVPSGSGEETLSWKKLQSLRENKEAKDALAELVDRVSFPYASAFASLLKSFHLRLVRLKEDRGLLDFQDLLRSALRLLDDPDFFKSFKEDFDLVLVDEYQDVNPMQDIFLSKLAGSNGLFCVGDVRQSIYRFRHADCGLFLEKISGKAKSGIRAVALGENYRSNKSIIDFVNTLFCDEKASGDFAFGRMTAMRKKAPKDAFPVEILLTPAEKNLEGEAVSGRRLEAVTLARRIRGIIAEGEYRFCDIAVILSQMTEIELYEAEFKRLGIPYHLVKGRGFYYKSEITDLIRALQTLFYPEREFEFMALVKSPLAGLSDDALFRFRKYGTGKNFFESFTGDWGSLGLSDQDERRARRFKEWFLRLRERRMELKIRDLIDEIIRGSLIEASLLARLDGERRLLNLIKLKEKAERFESFSDGTVDQFVRFVRTLSNREISEPEASVETEKSDAVSILTAHGAKGLEFPVVFIAGLGTNKTFARSEGSFAVTDKMEILPRLSDPGGGAAFEGARFLSFKEEKAHKEREEYLRLFYVAMTRAKDKLILSGVLRKDLVRPGKSTKSFSWLKWLIEKIPQIADSTHSDTPTVGNTPVRLIHSLTPPQRDPVRSDPVRPDPVRWGGVREQLFGGVRAYYETLNLTVTELLGRSGSREEGVGETPNGALRSIEREEDGSSGSAAQYGEMFHALLQHADFLNPGPDQIRTLLRIYCRHSDSKTKVSLAADLERFFKHPDFGVIREALRRGGRYYRELPFLYRIKEGDKDLGFLSGQADLLIRMDKSSWMLVDYKTGKKFRKQYEDQILVYAFCLKRLLHENITEARLYSSGAGEFRTVNLSILDDSCFEKDLVARFARVREELLTPSPHDAGVRHAVC